MPTGRSVANVTEYTPRRFRYVRAGDLRQQSQYYTTASVVGEITLQSLLVTPCTESFNMKKLYIMPTLCLSTLILSQKEQRILLYIA
jgi:hypothetical protein